MAEGATATKYIFASLTNLAIPSVTRLDGAVDGPVEGRYTARSVFPSPS